MIERHTIASRERFEAKFIPECPAPEIAAEYGVTRQTVHGIRKRRIWRHVD